MTEILSPRDPNVAQQLITEPPYLVGLNPEQRLAVETTEGPVLILAGAGTGKTRALTTRMAHLLSTGLAAPHEIFAVTFTNKAAREMRERVAHVLQLPQVDGIWIGTFHSLSARILRREANLIRDLDTGLGLQPNFTIIDDDDQEKIMKKILTELQFDKKEISARKILYVIEAWKNDGLLPDDVLKRNDARRDTEQLTFNQLHQLYAHYQKALLFTNTCDFGDLILYVLKLFREHPNLLAAYQRKFRYVMVDEFQDTNEAQYLLLDFLAQSHQNICVVGDDDQAIYAWRGARVDYMLNFEKKYPAATRITLDRNYRSTQKILDAANGIIAHNTYRLGKNLRTEKDGGDKIILINSQTNMDEAADIGQRISKLYNRSTPYNDIVILVRAASQMRALEESLNRRQIPYRIVGGPKFYERKEIRDALAYCRLVAQPRDDLAFERIVNLPKRGVGDTSLQKIYQLARQNLWSLDQASREEDVLQAMRPALRLALKDFTSALDRWRDQMNALPPAELVHKILEESGYLQMWRMEDTADSRNRLQNLDELQQAASEFNNLPEFLEYVSLVTERNAQQQDDAVTLMTLHAAKGLEFDYVFLSGWEQGIFPNQRALDDPIGGLEEERRLAYVGLTRARKHIVIYTSNMRKDYTGRFIPQERSIFIDEIPPTAIDNQTQPVYTPQQSSLSAWRDYGHKGSTRNYTTIDADYSYVPPSSSNKSDAVSENGYKMKDRVFHTQFGYGIIIGIEDDKVEVKFDKSGTKKLIDRYLSPADFSTD
jgi:DNA helicase-2/ATP-dependent DNA helicase PcrA